MPLPPSYQCPVCQKERQRGHIGDHVVSHTLDELKPFIVNSKEVIEKGAHPEVLCSGHSYILCIKSKLGFEKGFIKHKRHTCDNDYKSLIVAPVKTAGKPLDMNLMTMQQVLDICRKKNLRGYSHKKKEEIIEIILEHDKLSKPLIACNCHCEITQLKEELSEKTKELEAFKIWKALIISSAPFADKTTKPTETEPKETELLDIVYSESQESNANNVIKEVHPKIVTKPKIKVDTLKHPTVIKASKKEQEKGMFCTKCEVCNIVAKNNRELKPCAKCNKMCHFNSDFYNCYHWDCAYCGIQICMDCNKAAGGNKLFAFCSRDCSKKHNS